MPETPKIGVMVKAAQMELQRGKTTWARLLMYTARGLRGQTPTLDDYLRMGEVYIALHEPIRAFSASRQALILDPTNLHARYNMASAWNHVGAYQRALEICDAALEAAPHDIDFLNQKASALRYLHRYEESVTVLGVVTALAPMDAVAWHNVSLAFLKLKRFPDALEAARHSSVLQPTREEPWGVQGQAYEALGDINAAEQAYLAALQRDRWCLPALSGLQRVSISQRHWWAAVRLRVTWQVVYWFTIWRQPILRRHYRVGRMRMEQTLATVTRL